MLVVVGVVGAFVLWETVFPWAFAALRRWRRRARAKEAQEAAGKKADTEPGTTGTTEETTSVQQHAARTGAGEGHEARTEAAEEARTTELTEADRLWEEARGITHNFTPDWEEDQVYLAKVYGAAKLGHLEAMVKLGDYAYRRGGVVEAYYWTLIAELKGATGLGVALREMRSRWLS